MEAVEERAYQRQLKHAIDRALSELPADVADVLRPRNYDRLTLDEIGERWKLSRERIRQMENKGIRKLREPRIACILRPFMDFDFYSSTGLTAYQQSGMSVQERYVAMEEQRRERVYQQQKAEEERVKQALAEADRILARYHRNNLATNLQQNNPA